jgi:hypothetical protein
MAIKYLECAILNKQSIFLEAVTVAICSAAIGYSIGYFFFIISHQ